MGVPRGERLNVDHPRLRTLILLARVSPDGSGATGANQHEGRKTLGEELFQRKHNRTANGSLSLATAGALRATLAPADRHRRAVGER